MKTLDVTGICNGLVDVFADIAHEDFAVLGFEKGSYGLVTTDEQRELLSKVGTRNPVLVSGGSVANSMIAIAQLGGKSAMLSNIADDEYGRFYRDECVNLGMEMPVPLSGDGVTGTVVSMISPDAERTMRTALGACVNLSPEQIDHHTINASKWLFVEGYVFANGDSGRMAVSEAVRIACECNTKIALTCSDAWVIGGFRQPLMETLKSSALIFANEEESMALSGLADVTSAGRALKNTIPYVVVTAGSRGAYIWWEGEEIHVPAVACEPRDLTGAGDMFAGAFLYGITHGLSPSDSAHRACFLASRVISQVGARLNGDVRNLWSLKSDS